jgi:iron complex transport system substrate-binding protein
VYDLPSDLFGMSAQFNYPEALEHVRGVLWEEGDTETSW